jgi:hypothetical protein
MMPLSGDASCPRRLFIIAAPHASRLFHRTAATFIFLNTEEHMFDALSSNM